MYVNKDMQVNMKHYILSVKSHKSHGLLIVYQLNRPNLDELQLQELNSFVKECTSKISVLQPYSDSR